MSVFEVLLPAFVAGLILTGMLAYLGVHVVERGVIFVDLSLAQIAALGTTVGILAGYDMHSRWRYVFSLGFTLRRRRRLRVLARAPRARASRRRRSSASPTPSPPRRRSWRCRRRRGETEHLKEMLVGNILSVSWTELAQDGRRSSRSSGVFHFVLRKRFLLISMNEPEAERQGLSIRFWDFLFYVSFGFVVTLVGRDRGRAPRLLVPDRSVRLGDALLASGSACASRSAGRMGAIVSAVGVYLSYLWDLPTGATIVATLGAGLLLLSGVRLLTRRAA